MVEARRKTIVVGPSPDCNGGVSSVLAVYRDCGLFSAGEVDFVASYVDGGGVKKARTALEALLRVGAWLLRGRVACVHAHVAMDASFWRKAAFMLLAAAFRRPFIFHLHAGGFPQFYQDRLGAVGKALARWLFKHASAVIVLTPEWEQWVRGIEPASNTTIIPNPIDVRGAGSGCPESEMFLFLGRIGVSKGVYELLEAFSQVVRRHPRATLCLAGNGEIAEARARADALGIAASVHFPGWVRNEVKAGLMSRAGVVVLPSHFEGLPMSILESMAWGIPVVSTRVGGIPSAVTDGQEGLLVPPRDVDALGAALGMLLDDKRMRARMGAAGRARVDAEFSAESVLPRLRSVYARVIASAGSEGGRGA